MAKVFLCRMRTKCQSNDTLFVEADFREQIETMYTKYLFVNYQGVCVEYGILWFSQYDEGDFKITAINYHRR